MVETLKINRTFDEEEKDLFKTFIDTYMLPGVKTNNSYWQEGEFVEVIVNPGCNQQCSYCYLHNYGKDLYPMETRGTKEQQLKNLTLFLDYLIERKIFVRSWEIYGGDLLHDGILWDMFDIFGEKYKYIIETYPELISAPNDQRPIEIIVPNNMSYFADKKLQEKLLTYREKMLKESHCVLGFSWSTDGKYAVDTREKKELDDEYWDNLLTFARKIESGVHPMIASENIENWIKNYDWWLEVFDKYNFYDQPEHFQPPMLEVRNDSWTPEKINSYLKFIKHLWDVRFAKNNHDVYKMARHFFIGDGLDGSLPHASQMDPLITLPSLQKRTEERMTCSIQEQFHLILADLNIVPCHRTSYSFMRGGYFKVENDKIVDIEPHNVPLFLQVVSAPITMLPRCFNCDHRMVCMRGCLGAQYESSGELFLPIDSVCNLFCRKGDFIVKLLFESGVLQCAIENNFLDEPRKEYYLNICRKLGYKL